jgi:hypothetical protein
MLKKLFVTAAAAAAVSVPLAGAAWAEPPADPGAGNQGVPDRAAGAVESILGNPDALDGLQNGNSGVVSPGAAFKLGAKVPGLNTPDGYAVALNGFYVSQGRPDLATFEPPLIPGSVTTQFTPACRQHSSGVCIPESP